MQTHVIILSSRVQQTIIAIVVKKQAISKDDPVKMEKLFTLGIVDMIDGAYIITALGKEICNILLIIEDAIKIYNKAENA